LEKAESGIASVLAVLDRRGEGAPGQLHVAQELIEALPIPVFFKDRDGRYLGVNRAWEEFFGVTRQDMLGARVHDLYQDAPSVAARHHTLDEALWASPGRQSYEIPVTTRDGIFHHTLFYKATYTDAAGAVAGLIGTIIDITERKRAEQREAIEHAVAHHLGSTASIHDAIRGIIEVMCQRLDWACGARWSLDERDQRLHCIENWSLDDPAIRRFLDASARETFVPGSQGLIRRVLTTGASVWLEDVTLQEDFKRAELAWEAGLRGAFALPVVLGPRVLGAIEFFSREARKPDKWLLQITESVGNQIGQLMARREAEAAMRKSEARFRSLTELSSDWYWEQDADYRFTSMSRGLTEAIRMTQEAFLGKRRWDVQLVGMTPAQIEAHIAALDRRERFHDLEYGRRDASGALHWISVSGEPFHDDEGRFVGYRGIGKDITRRRLDEARLRAAHDELEQKAKELARSNEELQQFAYVASHDLQEPLRMVSSYTQLIGRRYGDKLDADGREFMAFIVDGAARMKQLIEDLLAYSRIGTRVHELRATDSGAALQKALSNLRGAQEASGAVVTHDPMPEVVADAAQLTQLFQNLIGNAMKFRGAEAPRIHVSAEATEQVWIFGVRDNGIGLDPQYADRIFMMFQRLHNRDEYPGTGIGLAICKKIVDRHGGRIWVESRPGCGATFGFTLLRNRNGEQQ
jgi:PAS domain S-box-containing protein